MSNSFNLNGLLLKRQGFQPTDAYECPTTLTLYSSYPCFFPSRRKPTPFRNWISHILTNCSQSKPFPFVTVVFITRIPKDVDVYETLSLHSSSFRHLKRHFSIKPFLEWPNVLNVFHTLVEILFTDTNRLALFFLSMIVLTS